MSETMLAALIGLAGTTVTAIATVVVAIIQTQKLRDERSTAREDRDIAAQTVRTLEVEAEVQSEHCSGSPASSSPGSGSIPAIDFAGTGGGPT